MEEAKGFFILVGIVLLSLYAVATFADWHRENHDVWILKIVLSILLILNNIILNRVFFIFLWGFGLLFILYLEFERTNKTNQNKKISSEPFALDTNLPANVPDDRSEQ